MYVDMDMDMNVNVDFGYGASACNRQDLGECGSLSAELQNIILKIQILPGRSQDQLDALAREINERGGEAVVTVCDHADLEATEELFRKIDQMV